MNLSMLSNPITLHLLRGLLFLAIVFVFLGILRHKSGKSFAKSCWRMVIVLLAILTTSQFFLSIWQVEILPEKSEPTKAPTAMDRADKTEDFPSNSLESPGQELATRSR